MKNLKLVLYMLNIRFNLSACLDSIYPEPISLTDGQELALALSLVGYSRTQIASIMGYGVDNITRHMRLSYEELPHKTDKIALISDIFIFSSEHISVGQSLADISIPEELNQKEYEVLISLRNGNDIKEMRKNGICEGTIKYVQTRLKNKFSEVLGIEPSTKVPMEVWAIISHLFAPIKVDFHTFDDRDFTPEMVLKPRALVPSGS